MTLMMNNGRQAGRQRGRGQPSHQRINRSVGKISKVANDSERWWLDEEKAPDDEHFVDGAVKV